MVNDGNHPGGGLKDAATIGTAVAASAAVAALSVGATPLAAAGLAASGASVTGIAGIAASFVIRRRERRLRTWIDEYVRAMPGSDMEIAEAELHAKGDDPLVQEVVIEGARAIEEALADIVVPALARLTREYVSGGKRGDAFFRGTRRLLADLEGDEYPAMQSLVHTVLALDVAAELPMVQLQFLSLKPDSSPVLTYLRPNLPEVVRATSVRNDRVEIGPFPTALRMFHLLKVNGLGSDTASGAWGADSGPHVVQVRVETMKRLHAVLV